MGHLQMFFSINWSAEVFAALEAAINYKKSFAEWSDPFIRVCQKAGGPEFESTADKSVHPSNIVSSIKKQIWFRVKNTRQALQKEFLGRFDQMSNAVLQDPSQVRIYTKQCSTRKQTLHIRFHPYLTEDPPLPPCLWTKQDTTSNKSGLVIKVCSLNLWDILVYWDEKMIKLNVSYK